MKTDEFGKSEMDYFVDTKMDFGKDEELPVGPAPVRVVKSVTSGKIPSKATKRWAPSKPITNIKDRPKTAINPANRAAGKPTRMTNTFVKPKIEKFIREDMRDEVETLEREELELCRDDDFGMSFDLEL